jgi:hypothetical protein
VRKKKKKEKKKKRKKEKEKEKEKEEREREREERVVVSPMISVTNAETNTDMSMTIITPGVGPCSPSKLPLLLHNHKNAFFPGQRTNTVHATAQSRIYTAVTPEEALTSAIVSARRIQPITSFPTPAERTIWPTRVSSSLVSVRMRHRTGNAVMLMATPVKSRK